MLSFDEYSVICEEANIKYEVAEELSPDEAIMYSTRHLLKNLQKFYRVIEGELEGIKSIAAALDTAIDFEARKRKPLNEKDKRKLLYEISSGYEADHDVKRHFENLVMLAEVFIALEMLTIYPGGKGSTYYDVAVRSYLKLPKESLDEIRRRIGVSGQTVINMKSKIVAILGGILWDLKEDSELELEKMIEEFAHILETESSAYSRLKKKAEALTKILLEEYRRLRFTGIERADFLTGVMEDLEVAENYFPNATEPTQKFILMTVWKKACQNLLNRNNHHREVELLKLIDDSLVAMQSDSHTDVEITRAKALFRAYLYGDYVMKQSLSSFFGYSPTNIFSILRSGEKKLSEYVIPRLRALIQER